MGRPLQKLQRFFRELKRRNVYRVAVTYAVVGFVLIQVADLVFPALRIPSWAYRLVVVLVLLGFPVALVLAWAFEMSPEGVRRTPDAELEQEPRPETKARTRTAYKVLVGIGLVAAAVAGGWYLTGGGGERPEVTEGTVAVLPFEVSGAADSTWHDGMVTYLTPGLDGAAGFRAIPDRTVFAAWEERAHSQRGASAEQALSVAREIGSEYAVIGSAAELGSEVRFSVQVYGTETGERLGQVEVRGSPDSVPSLADSLTRQLLGVLLEEGGDGMPSVDLGRITTRSLPALKSYLKGERHFRKGEYDEAIEDFEAATKRDSTFALAYARLSDSYGWVGGFDQARRYARRAYALSHRLPARDRRLQHVVYLRDVENRPWVAVDSLRQLTEVYPDDPSIWYELGETIVHRWIPADWEEAEEAFRRAVELDPGNAGYHHHLVGLALWFHRDSALAARRIAAHPGTGFRDLYGAAFDLMFGSPERRENASARLVSFHQSVLPVAPWGQGWPLVHPKDLELQERVLRTLRDESDRGSYGAALAWNHLQRGQIDAALPLIRDAAETDAPAASCLAATSLRLGYPLPDSVARPLLAPSSLRDDAPLQQLRCSAYYLIDRGRSGDLSQVMSRLRDQMAAEDDPRESDRENSTLDELRAYRAWKDGVPKRAAELLGQPKRSTLWPYTSPIVAIWWGDLKRQLGQFETAEGWYMRAWIHPVAHERLGQLYEEMGEPEKAAAAYRRFIEAWKKADEELQPRVEAARERVRQLTSGQVTSEK